MEQKQPESGGVAVWYFVGATFLLAGTTFLGESGGPILRIAGIVLGGIVLVAGIVVFRRELTARK
jgi:small basic protein